MIKKRELKEMTQIKLHEMASILLDDIIVPGEIRQEGEESIVASCVDRNGNKFIFNLSLTVVPEEIVQVDPTPTLSDQVSTIIDELSSIKDDISTLKGYHTEIEVTDPDENLNSETDPNSNVDPINQDTEIDAPNIPSPLENLDTDENGD